jgi:hypothetical protein
VYPYWVEPGIVVGAVSQVPFIVAVDPDGQFEHEVGGVVSVRVTLAEVEQFASVAEIVYVLAFKPLNCAGGPGTVGAWAVGAVIE